MRPIHAILAAIVCLVLPGGSWLTGSGALAWTMFSGSRSYRLEIAGTFPDGTRRPLAPSALGRFAGIEEAPYFVSADRWRMMPSRGLHLRLAEVAQLACRLGPVKEVEITLFTKRNLDAEAKSRVERVTCDRGAR